MTRRVEKCTYHIIDIFENGGKTTDDKGELVLGDINQTFLVVLCADFGVGVLVSNFNGKLRKRTKKPHKIRGETFSK